jgi:ABC-type dipeptide/oligopeptide/nickel transport system permease subunit
MLQVPKLYIIFLDEELPLEMERDPIFIEFINYIVSFFTGEWGFSISRNRAVSELLRSSVPRMIEIMIIPLVIGVILGKILKKILVKHNRMRKFFKVLGVIGIVTPIFLFGIYLQHIFIRILPVNKWNGDAPPLITGFLVLDSIITGQWELTLQIFVYYILPTLFLTILIITLTARKLVDKPAKFSHNNSIISNSLKTGIIFDLIFIYYILIDLTFALLGFTSTLYYGLRYYDFYLLQGCMFIIIILFVISIFISNLYFILKSPDSNLGKFVNGKYIEQKDITNLKEEAIQLKKFLIARFKSPFSLVGASVIVFLIVIATFPQLITPYTLYDIIPPKFGDDPYAPPSRDHPLGTAHYGYDLLALLIWGMRDLITSGGWIILIGLLGGLPFGIIASKFNRSDKQIVVGVMSLFYIFPSIVIIIFMLMISEGDHSVQSFIIGILLIPVFTRKIANAKPKFISILKELIIYIPSVLVFVVMLYTSASFLGFTDIRIPQLGYIVYRAYRSGYFLERYWVVFWSGLAICTLNIGLVLIYIGLNSGKPEIRK